MMGDGQTPGPEDGYQDQPDDGTIARTSGGKPGPIAAKQGVAQNLVLTGWPRIITWDDFREIGSRPSGESEDAQVGPETITGNVATVQEGGRWKLAELSIDIVINQDLSWVVGSRKSPALLAHEQAHFDIQGILVGRDVLAALGAIRTRTNAQLGRRVRATFERYRLRAQGLSDSYDENTRHGLDTARQSAWEQQIGDAISNNSRLRAPN